MRALIAIVLGLVLGIGAAVWLARDEPASPARPQRGVPTDPAQVTDTTPALYRWRDANGVLQITDTPPKGRRYERILRDPQPGIAVDAARAD